MLTTFAVIYLILGLPAAFLVWMMLKASKGRENMVQDRNYDRSNYNQFHERRTEPNRIRS